MTSVIVPTACSEDLAALHPPACRPCPWSMVRHRRRALALSVRAKSELRECAVNCTPRSLVVPSPSAASTRSLRRRRRRARGSCGRSSPEDARRRSRRRRRLCRLHKATTDISVGGGDRVDSSGTEPCASSKAVAVPRTVLDADGGRRERVVRCRRRADDHVDVIGHHAGLFQAPPEPPPRQRGRRLIFSG